ncbi:MAG: riboflavin synthase [Candidatus Eiseniibacteriota bacterium]|jgi:riboflavin synthase
MFTGIIEEVGTIGGMQPAGGVTRLDIRARGVVADLTLGGSVAVNGCCLSAVEVGDAGFSVEAIPETLRRTNLGGLRVGARVNLERSLRMGARLEGHWVQGHVDAVVRLRGRRREGERSERFEFELPAAVRPYVVEKGSVGLDGTSLTVGEVTPDGFAVYLIPHTLVVTTLGDRRPGDRVNLEVDILAKYVERLLEAGRVEPRGGAGRTASRRGAPHDDGGGGLAALLDPGGDRRP